MANRRDNGNAEGDGQPNRRRNNEPDYSPFWTAAVVAGGAAALVGGAFALANLSCNKSSSSYISALSKEMDDFYREHRQTDATYNKKVQIKDALHSVIRRIYPVSELFIVGSSASGFGTEESDLDLCLVIGPRGAMWRPGCINVLNQLINPLRDYGYRSCLVPATVPILQLHDVSSGIDCDLNVNNVEGRRNTCLLSAYARVDPRLPTLGVFVKHWAREMDIHDAKQGRLNSYALRLMVIQYLQCGCSPPVLPNLQALYPKLFGCSRPVEELDMDSQLPWKRLRSANGSSVGELFAGFVAYYASFDFAHQAVSIKSGCPIDIEEIEGPFAERAAKIFIEEPCGRHNVAHAVRDDAVFEDIRRAFSRTNEALQTETPLQSLCRKPPLVSTSWSGASTENSDDGCLLM